MMTTMIRPAGLRTYQEVEQLEELYTSHFESLVRCAIRLLDTRVLAEEAVQEAFLRYQSSGAAPQPGAEVAYLRTSVLNNARSMLRRRQCAEHWRPETPRYTPGIDELCVTRDSDRRLWRLCQNLPTRQREVVALRYWGGLSVAETANALGVSVGAVKTHASRGRSSLRQLLQQASFGEG